MKKEIILKISVALLICLASLFAVLPLQFAGADGGAWMSRLEDSRDVNTLAIPGTHDSGATHSIADLSGKCQSLSIGEQLKLGVRFFDIRLQLKNNELVIVHSFVDQATDFSDVLDEMNEFLDANPGEFLIVSIKQDADPSGSNVDFTETLEKMLRDCDRVSESTALPKKVGEARGKIHIISRYSGSTLGYPAHSGWADSTSFELGELYVQDKYQVDDADTKIANIEMALIVGVTKEYSLVLNFASCYYPDAFPPTYAGLPAHTINGWLIRNLPKRQVCGVLLCDFMTEELCETIIGRNFE